MSVTIHFFNQPGYWFNILKKALNARPFIASVRPAAGHSSGWQAWPSLAWLQAAGEAWHSCGTRLPAPCTPHTRLPAVPTFQGASRFSKYVPHKNKIEECDALWSPVCAAHNSFAVSMGHYSHIPPAELSISSPAKLESEYGELSDTMVVWAHYLPFLFSHSFLTVFLFSPLCKKDSVLCSQA